MDPYEMNALDLTMFAVVFGLFLKALFNLLQALWGKLHFFATPEEDELFSRIDAELTAAERKQRRAH